MLIISAVICTYNRYGLLEKAIASLQNQSLDQKNYEIIVVDNFFGSSEYSLFKKKYDGVGNIRYFGEEKAGLSYARNKGLAECQSPYIAYMDDDAIADKNWLENIVHAYRKFGKSAGIVGGTVRPLWDAPQPAWLDDSLLSNLSVVDWGGDLRIASSTEWFAGTNISYDVGVLKKYGGFDTNLGRNGRNSSLLGNEEISITNTIKNDGYLAVFAPLAIVDHLVPIDRLNRMWFRKRAAWQAVSDLLTPEGITPCATESNWENVVAFINSLLPENRSLRGLFMQVDDKDAYKNQVHAVYDLMLCLLSNFELSE